jgi:hypothetical protein
MICKLRFQPALVRSALLSEPNVIELKGKYGVHHPCPRQAGVMMRLKEDLFLHLKIKSLNSMTLGPSQGFTNIKWLIIS